MMYMYYTVCSVNFAITGYFKILVNLLIHKNEITVRQCRNYVMNICYEYALVLYILYTKTCTCVFFVLAILKLEVLFIQVSCSLPVQTIKISLGSQM